MSKLKPVDVIEVLRITDTSFPRDALMFEGIDAPRPNLSVGEVALIFGRSPSWVRSMDSKGNLLFDGKYVGPHRTESGHRYFLLPDVEMMAHSLCESRSIDAEHMVGALTVLRGLGKTWGYLP